MMRSSGPVALAATALAIAGCFSDRGLVIEIDVGDTGATSVALFLGMTPCGASVVPAGIDCRTIAPPPAGSPPLRGDIWFRDDAAGQVVTVQGRRATFQLRSDAATTIPLVVAVATVPADGPGGMMREVAMAVLSQVSIPTDTGRVLRTTMLAAGPMMPGGPPPSGPSADRVMVWNKPQNACVAIEHWQDGMVVTRSFIVPASDPDCDDVVAPECAPSVFLGTANAGQAASADCLSSQGDGCELGSHGCSDGDDGRRGGECAPQQARTCVPDAFCGCPAVDPACFENRLAGADMPRIDCHFPMDDKLSLCQNNASATIALGGPPMGGATCAQPRIGDLTLDRFATSAEFGGATLTLSAPRDPCNFAITWSAGTRTTSDPVSFGAIELAGHSGALVLPLVVHFDQLSLGGCASALTSSCQIMAAPDDGVWACTQ